MAYDPKTDTLGCLPRRQKNMPVSCCKWSVYYGPDPCNINCPYIPDEIKDRIIKEIELIKNPKPKKRKLTVPKKPKRKLTVPKKPKRKLTIPEKPKNKRKKLSLF